MPVIDPMSNYEEALKRIADCHRSGGTMLELSGLNLTTVPPEIGKLTALTTLYINTNQLTSLPRQIGRLTALTTLSLSENLLNSLPSEIGQLTALERLYLFANQLTTVPPEIGQLTALTTLDINTNHLTDLPPEIGHLTALTKLSLSENQLTSLPSEIGRLTLLTELYLVRNRLTCLPPEIGKLTALTTLSLSENRLTHLPPEIGRLMALTKLSLFMNLLTRLPVEIGQLTALTELYLRGNPGLGIPPEIFGPTMYDVSLQRATAKPPSEILDYYFRNRTAAIKQPILEAKVILVGWGAVGKTSLRRRLVDGTFNESEEKTHKIEITPWRVKVGQDDVKLHIWDFGGQEIMHATHQFFLTKRSLYVLVLVGREKVQGAQEAEYWLRLIQSFGGGSPVLVVLNKQHTTPFDLNRQSLVEKYPFIKGFVQTDCQPEQNLDTLRKRILEEVDNLPELRTEFDARWMAIKDEVTDLRRKGIKRLAVADYLILCDEKGERESKWQRWLLGFLHDLGVVVCFRDDPRLVNDGMLDPQWVVDGIYKVLNEPKLNGGDGQVLRGTVRALLSRADYSDDDVRVLLEMMEKFELCFPLQGSRDTMVVPELMTEQETEWKPIFPELEKCLRFELKYDFLPAGLVPRFIVATHNLSKPGERWRSGVILRQRKNIALIRGDAVACRVSIAVNGPEPTRRDLLAVIRNSFAMINGSIQGLVVKERVPVPGLNAEPLEYEHLLAAECAKPPRTHWTVVVDGALHDVPITTLLDGIEPRDEREARVDRDRQERIIYAAHYHEREETMKDDHSIHIGGNVTNSQVGQTMTNCTNMIQQQAPGERKDLLEELQKQVQELIEKLPDEKKDKAPKIARDLKMLVEQSTSDEPERAWYSLSAKGMLEAATWVKDLSGEIAGTIGNLGKLLWPDFRLPGSE
jgi:internalin A